VHGVVRVGADDVSHESNEGLFVDVSVFVLFCSVGEFS